MYYSLLLVDMSNARQRRQPIMGRGRSANRYVWGRSMAEEQLWIVNRRQWNEEWLRAEIETDQLLRMVAAAAAEVQAVEEQQGEGNELLLGLRKRVPVHLSCYIIYIASCPCLSACWSQHYTYCPKRRKGVDYFICGQDLWDEYNRYVVPTMNK